MLLEVLLHRKDLTRLVYHECPCKSTHVGRIVERHKGHHVESGLDVDERLAHSRFA